MKQHKIILKPYTEQKKLEISEYILYDSIFMKCKSRQNLSDIEIITFGKLTQGNFLR